MKRFDLLLFGLLVGMLLVVCGLAQAHQNDEANPLYTPPDSATFIYNCIAGLDRMAPDEDVKEYCLCMNRAANGNIRMFVENPNLLQSAKQKCQSILLEQYQ